MSEPAAHEPWSCDLVTLFPTYFDWMFESRPIANAIAAGSLRLAVHDLRSYSRLKHAQVDDTPYGGGAGMVLRVDCVVDAIEGIYGAPLAEVRANRAIMLLTPAGEQFTDAVAAGWAASPRATTLLCGRYEGFDHRVHEHVATGEVSVGPYVLSGGEIAAMAVVDAVARKLPGALGNAESLLDETFSEELEGGSEYPHYTRPPEYRGWTVPEVLLGGHHAQIGQWRRDQSQLRTARGSGDATPPA